MNSILISEIFLLLEIHPPIFAWKNSWDWMVYDVFDDYMKEHNSISKENCRIHSGKRMSADTVHSVPTFNTLLYVNSSFFSFDITSYWNCIKIAKLKQTSR